MICIYVYFLNTHIFYDTLILAFRIMFSEFSSPIIQLFVVRWSYISFCVMQPEVMIKRRWGQLRTLTCFFFLGGGMFFWGGGGGCGCDSLELKSCWSLTIDDFFFTYFWSSQPWFLRETNDTKGGEEKPTQSSPKCQFTGRWESNAMRHCFEFLQ